MAYWLLKSEPHTWSWDQQKKEGRKGTSGTCAISRRARTCRRCSAAISLFYHSGEEKSVVGIVKVVAEAHPDSTDHTGVWQCVDVAAVKDLARPVTLSPRSRPNRLLSPWSWLKFAPLGAAGIERRMEDSLRHGRRQDPRALSAEKAPLG